MKPAGLVFVCDISDRAATFIVLLATWIGSMSSSTTPASS